MAAIRYIPDKDNIIKINFNSPTGFVLSYIDLMTHLKYTKDAYLYDIYIVIPLDDEGAPIRELTEKEKEINAKIENVSSFNVSVYTIIRTENKVTGGITDYEISPAYYENISVNDYFLKRPNTKAPKKSVDGSSSEDKETERYNNMVLSIPDYRIISNMKSVLFNNTGNLAISIDSVFPEYDKDGKLKYDDDGNPIYTSIPDGTTFSLYITVDTTNGKTAEMYYEFTYVKIKEEENKEEEDNSNAENDWNMGFDENELPVEFGGFELSDERWADYVFLNTVSVNQLRKLKDSTLKSYDGISRVYISPLCPEPFTFRLNVIRKSGETVVYTFNYVPKKLNITEPNLTHVIKMNNPDVSYALVRTNPKLTGNVKVVIDSSSNIFLDTFKISNTLSSRRYRKIKVGGNSYYGSALMKYYKDIPTSEFYKIEDKCCNLFTTVQSYGDQYYDTYRCGVKTNDDKLYNENFAMLAPLCVKRVMPDFFLIFRVDKSLEDYNEQMSDNEKLEYFLRFGKLVKSFDMRQHSPIGQYIRNIYENSKNEAGDMYVSYDTDNYNKFIGISLDRGVVSSMYESIHLEKSINSQVALNDFYTSGFERNHIVSKDIINFEFMFDDTEPGLFSIKTYFGLYVKVNTETNDFSCIDSSIFKQKINLAAEGIAEGEGESTGKTKDIEKTKYIFDTSVHSYAEGTDLRLSNKGTLIYGLTTPKEFIRLDTGIFDAECMKDYLLRPYKNIMTSKAIKHPLNESQVSFVTLQLNKPLEVGDHIRVIDTNNRVMYEVIMADIENAMKTQGRFMDSDNISEITTNYYNEYSTNYTIHRISMFINYRDSFNDSSMNNEIKQQIIQTHISQLFAAFRKFYSIGGVTAYKKEGNKLSIISDAEHVLFQRICAPSGFISSLNTYLNESNDEDDTILFFGQLYPEKVILNIDKFLSGTLKTPEWKTKQYAYLYPLNFDIVGNRMSYIMSFLSTKSVADYEYFYSAEVLDKTIFDATTILYDQYVDGKMPEHSYVKYKKIPLNIFYNPVDKKTGKRSTNIIERKTVELDYIESFDDFNTNIINIQRPVLQHGGQFSIYSSYPLNAGICSILQYKDFDFEVLDKDSVITSSNVSMPIGSGGEFTEKSFFNRRPNDNVNETGDETVDEEEFEFGVYLPDNDRNDNYNPLSSMFVPGDSVLAIGEERYVIKHYTVEEFKEHILDRIRNIGFTSITMDSPLTPEGSNVKVTLTNLITDTELQCIQSILGYGDLADYDGYILRPFIPGTRAYDRDYEYFNYLISFETAYTGRTDFVTSRDFDDYKEIKYKYDRWSESALEVDKDGNYVNPPDYFRIEVDPITGKEHYVEYGLDELVYEGTESCVAPILEGVKKNATDENTYYYFPIDDLLNRTISPVYTSVKINKLDNDDVNAKPSYEIIPQTALTNPAKALGSEPLDLNNAAFTSYKVVDLFTPEQIYSVRNIEQIVKFGEYGRVLQRDFACFINEWNLKKCEKAENPKAEVDGGGESGGVIMEDLTSSVNPIRDTSEENIQDYINKFNSFEDELKGLSFAKSNVNNYKNRSQYLKILYDNNHTRFDVPLVSPGTCKWKGNGTDARIENMRIMYDYDKLKETDSYYVVGDGTYDSYLGVLYLKERNTTSCGAYPNYQFNKYINKSLDDVMFTKENTETLGYYAKDYILNGVGCLDDILYDSKSKKNKFSTTYLSGQNTLEFISGGIKFRIRSNNDNVIDFSKYVGYSAVFVNLPFNNTSINSQTELIIDELRNEIMLIWYSYCNTLRYGVKLEQMENATEVFNELFPIKLNYTKSISDIICSQIVDITTSEISNAVLIEDTMGLSKVETINPPAEYIKDGKIYHLGQKLCKDKGFIYLSSMGVNTNDFTKSNNVCITSKIFDKKPITNNISITFPYYAKTGYITPINPFIWHNNVNAKYNYHEELSNGAIDKYAYDLSKVKDCILYTDDIENAPTNKRSVGELKDMLRNHSVYVKTANGTKNYSTVNNLLEIEMVDPIEYNRDFLFTRQTDKKLSDDGKPVKTYKVHSTYATPVMKDIFNFNYNSLEIDNNTKPFKKAGSDVEDTDNTSQNGGSFSVVMEGDNESIDSQSSADSLEAVFGKSFDGGNVSIQSVNSINQIWINKYTEDSNYCSQRVENISTYAIPAILHKNEKALREKLYDTGYSLVKDDNDSDVQKEEYVLITTPRDMTFRIMKEKNASSYIASEENLGVKYTDCEKDEKKFIKCITPSKRISVDHTMLLSVDVIDKVSVLDDSWESTTFRKYEIDRINGITEKYENVKGYRTGLEIKTFFNSKGIVLKSKNQSAEVEITNWKNTYINEEEGYIRLDINDSLVYSILQSGPFIESWQPLYLTTNEYKINYIKNYVLKFININNKTKFVLRKDKSMLKSLRFNGIYDDNFEEVKNFKNELKHENGKYYMYVYPTEKHMYYAKMIINL